ncbi:MAG: Rrf2 family transcriptional regulator [Proteobacteria bacterium]|nr:Rrf2 family transcriptional regulator [Pseudomonadota bacterium]
MLRVSEAVNIAFHAMFILARQPAGGQLSTSQLAKRLRSSENHLAKVMQRLSKSTLITSRRGPTGGFWLGKSPDRITLLEIYESIEGPLSDDSCLLDNPFCDAGCFWMGDLPNLIRGHLSGTTLASVAENK